MQEETECVQLLPWTVGLSSPHTGPKFIFWALCCANVSKRITTQPSGIWRTLHGSFCCLRLSDATQRQPTCFDVVLRNIFHLSGITFYVFLLNQDRLVSSPNLDEWKETEKPNAVLQTQLQGQSCCCRSLLYLCMNVCMYGEIIKTNN